MEEAAKWYGELVNYWEIIDPEYYFRYAMSLRSIEEYEESNKWMKKFHELNPNDSRGKAFLAKIDYVDDIEMLSNNTIELNNLDINSQYSDFGVAEFNSGIVFASARGEGMKYMWNNQPFLDLFIAQGTADGNYQNPKPLIENVNTKLHESSAAISQDETLMFFTRNNYFDDYIGRDSQGVNRLQLYRTTVDNAGNWSVAFPVHFNSREYSVAHPTITLDGRRLYFASDIPGGYGESDIYVVDILSDGSLGIPKNLGPSINTEGQESFPFINTNGDLFFASKGFPGLGGFDVFVSKGLDNKAKEGDLSNFAVKNMGKPINSPKDDFAYYENLTTRTGFLSSNRDGGKGSDDIYTFSVPECAQIVQGTVIDRKTKELVSGATVILYDRNGEEISFMNADEDSAFTFNVDCNEEYLVRGVKDGYIGDEQRIRTSTINEANEVVLELEQDEQEVTVGTDLAPVLDIPIIYFDYDKYNIRYDASVELQKVLAVLNQYPSMEIEIRSHTDSRGKAKYNKTLSNNRAQSTMQYLIDNGIAPERLTANGFGESRLVNDCFDGENCSEAEHQLNRRSEFIIVKM
ncbi:MAG: OmpA family protein [Winogradskyella sp.]|nr:OmpA family protein [Winogradskyella sp.]